MPTDACQFFYDCKSCGRRLKPMAGDCCVFCSYGTVPCPSMQAGDWLRSALRVFANGTFREIVSVVEAQPAAS